MRVQTLAAEPSNDRLARAHERRFRLGLLGALSLLGIAYTWPVALHISNNLPNYGAPPVVAWILSWQAHALTSSPLHLYDGPMFYPFEHAILLSESMFGGALLATPVWVLTHQPAALFNLLLLASFPIAGFGSYLLLSSVTQSRIAGVVAAIAYAFGMFRLSQVHHLHVALIIWIPYVFFYLHRFLLTRRWSDAWGFAASIWLQVVFSFHGALMLGMALLVLGPLLLIRHRHVAHDGAFWLRSGVCLLALVIALLPFTVPYVQLYRTHPEFRRDPREVALYSAKYPTSFLNVPQRSRIYASQPLSGLKRTICGHTCPGRNGYNDLYPGSILLGLAACSLLTLRQPRHDERTWLLGFAGITVICGALSLGSDRSLSGPYGFAYRLFPELDTIRVPGRIMIVVTFGLAGLAALTTTSLLRLRPFHNHRPAIALGCALSALLLLDVIPKPAGSVPMPPIPKIYRTLARSTSRAAIVELPITVAERDDDGRVHTSDGFVNAPFYVYAQTAHWRPIVNGRSSNVPNTYMDATQRIRSFPDGTSISFLRTIGVGCVIVHRDLIAHTRWANVEAKLKPSRDAIILDDGMRFVVDVSRLHPPDSGAKPCL